MQYQRLSISDELIKEKVKTFIRMLNIPNDQCPNFSNGWLHAFKQRNGFKRYRSHGESGDADMEEIEERLKHIRLRIAEYDIEDIYNFDEIGLFYNLASDTTIARRQIEGILFNEI
jgi:Tc5 transposase DNA-binding domain